jgi:NAD(P)-dependent dehydrogenase (short-subunit alcohol dehydrogenase family)
MGRESRRVGPQVALVTGAAAGMGLVTARRFLAGGWRVAAWDIDEDALSKAWADAHADRALPRVVDVSDPEATDAGAAAVLRSFGRIDVVVNNAALHGAAWNTPALQLSHERWRTLLDVNVLGIVNVCRSTAEALEASAGVVINISSMTGYGHGPSSAYSVTKYAVNGLTASLSDELGKRGVRVHGLAPGFIATETVLNSLGPRRAEELVSKQVLPFAGQPDDIAAITAFLASPQARMIAGQTIIADAGITRRS